VGLSSPSFKFIREINMNSYQHKLQATAGMRELTQAESQQLSGGMKWDRGVSNGDVIDVRGGTVTFGGLTFGFDISGHLSSISVN
jgi:hypothetical protein